MKNIIFLAVVAIIGAAFGAVAGSISLIILSLGTIFALMFAGDMNFALVLFAVFSVVGAPIGAICAVRDASMLSKKSPARH